MDYAKFWRDVQNTQTEIQNPNTQKIENPNTFEFLGCICLTEDNT